MPARSAVARFAAAVLTGLAEIGEPGMPYPAQFRLRSQPLQPVIDALGHHATPPDTATTPNTATDAVTEAAVGEALAEPVSEPQQKVGTHMALSNEQPRTYGAASHRGVSPLA